MKIDAEQNPAVCGKYISSIYRKSGEHLAQELKKIGLTTVKSILLVGLYRNEGTNQCALAAKLSLDTAAASRGLRILELEGMIRKEVDEANRRNFKVFLTEAGRLKAEESLRAQERYWKTVLKPLGENGTDLLNDLLRQLQDSIGAFSADDERNDAD